MKTIKSYRLELIGLAAGAAAGWFYWFFIGCANGSCAIASKPLNSTLYGAVMGFLIFSLFKSPKQNKNKSYDQ